MFAGLAFIAQIQWNKGIKLFHTCWFAYVLTHHCDCFEVSRGELYDLHYISTFRISKSQVHFDIFSNYLFRFGEATSRKHLIMMATGQEMRSHQIEEIRPFGLIYE